MQYVFHTTFDRNGFILGIHVTAANVHDSNMFESILDKVKKMQGYRKSAHATYALKYHIVWITKYRKPVLGGKIGERTRELVRMVCKNNEVEILAGHVGKEHIHLLVSVPPHLSISKLVQYIKGYTSRKLLMENKELTLVHFREKLKILT